MKNWKPLNIALVLVLLLPLAGTYMISMSCVVGDVLFSCCEVSHPRMANTEIDRHKNNGFDHGSEDPGNNCCTGFSAGAISIFQVLPVQALAEMVMDMEYLDYSILTDNLSNNFAGSFFAYTGLHPPQLFYVPGVQLRILYQSFLN